MQDEVLIEGPSAFREVPKTGVIYVMGEAFAAGYRGGDPEWTNFGQGQPECGALPGAPERLDQIGIAEDDHEYAPIMGIQELREAVAEHYNALYRKDKASKYTYENVCISSGGRTALTRVATALGPINLGHFLPDYTAYEELLSVFRLFSPIPILLDPDRGYHFSIEELRREILGRGLSAILASNPCNPTGKTVSGPMLRGWVETASELDCALILDEFYSHYLWKRTGDEATMSAAAYVEDVDRDPVVIINGLTKNYRYPGWRVAWTLAPKSVIDRVASAGSFLDGGAARPLQRAAIPLLDAERTHVETEALQKVFRKKRQLLLGRLTAMGIRVELPPEGTFYIWGNVADLPAPLNTGMEFFQTALTRKVICVPGVFFDVNPGNRRAMDRSRFNHHVRFSFGPSQHLLEQGLDRLDALIADARAGKLADHPG